jgi:nucleoside-diphosphate-sugar epimerase
MRILWAGWGDLGQRATPGLVAAGHEVVALRRSPMDTPPDGVVAVQGDLAAPRGLQLPPGIEACIVTLTPDSRDRAGYEQAYLTSLTNLHALVEDQGLPVDPGPHREGERGLLRLVFASSTAVYGVDDGSWVEEAASTSPSRFNGEVMQEAERRVLAHGGTHGVVARLGGIYGPGRRRLVRAVKAGRPASRKWTNRIHSDDAAAALVHLATIAAPLVPDVVNVVDREPARKHDVVTFIAEELGVPAPDVDDDVARGKRVDGTRLVTTGFEHGYPTYREGYRQVLAARDPA